METPVKHAKMGPVYGRARVCHSVSLLPASIRWHAAHSCAPRAGSGYRKEVNSLLCKEAVEIIPLHEREVDGGLPQKTKLLCHAIKV